MYLSFRSLTSLPNKNDVTTFIIIQLLRFKYLKRYFQLGNIEAYVPLDYKSHLAKTIN